MTAALTDLSAAALGRAFAAAEVSPVDVCTAVINRIAALDPELHACCHLDPEASMRAAVAAEGRWRAGEARGPLDGVPVTLKENVATEGVPLRLGTAATLSTPAPEDAPIAARLREAGAVLVAKTTMPDYGMISSGVSSLHPTTRNPWNTALTPGGSSAGAAVAAAVGYGPLHVGTDIGGSIRLPAGWTGVVGLKPSFGRVPVTPPYYGRAAGPLTRTVADAALLLATLAQADPRDHMSLPADALPAMVEPLDLTGLRIGLLADAGAGLAVHPEVRAAVAGAAHSLERAGAEIAVVPPVLTDEMLDGLDRFWRMRSLLDLEALPPERRARVLPYIERWAAAADRMSGRDTFTAFSQMDTISGAVRDAMHGLDFLVSPVAPIMAFGVDLPTPSGDPRRTMEHIGFSVPFSMSGHPAMSLPWSTGSDGRPIGLQLVGHRFADADVLRLGLAGERIRPPQPAWPAESTIVA